LRAVVAESVARNQVLANRRKVELKVRVTEGLEVFGDAEMLTTATKNLIENAINYSEPGSSVRVMAKATNGAAEISVKDSGVGIAPQELDRVFERFYRVDQSRSRTTGGTGLGLSLVKNIAAKHLGEVSVKSKVGKGSTFYLRLPIATKQVSGK
jgi:two-component system sensor histidine kinase SenX3